jgi:hypothetical protein
MALALDDTLKLVLCKLASGGVRVAAEVSRRWHAHCASLLEADGFWPRVTFRCGGRCYRRRYCPCSSEVARYALLTPALQAWALGRFEECAPREPGSRAPRSGVPRTGTELRAAAGRR